MDVPSSNFEKVIFQLKVSVPPLFYLYNKNWGERMRKLIVLMIVLFLFGFIGCTTVTEVVTEEQLEKSMEENGADDVEVDIKDGGKEMTIETEEGTVNVKTDMKNVDDWCATGSNWKYAADVDDGQTNAKWEVLGMASGEYAGLCHVKYTAVGPEGDATMDYYFSEDGESGYFEMDVGGQVMKQEWHN